MQGASECRGADQPASTTSTVTWPMRANCNDWCPPGDPNPWVTVACQAATVQDDYCSTTCTLPGDDPADALHMIYRSTSDGIAGYASQTTLVYPNTYGPNWPPPTQSYTCWWAFRATLQESDGAP